MPFKITSASVDLINKTATIVAKDPPTESAGATICMEFYFESNAGEDAGRTTMRVIQEAEQLLKQAANEISTRSL
jgi:hypothetical protein